MDLYEGEKYFCSVEDVNNYLDTYGVAIIPNLLNDNECQDIIDGMFDYLENLTMDTPNEINRDNESTYRNFNNLIPTKSMILQHWSIGHAQYIWNVRQNKKIIDVFSNIYDVSNNSLLVSFDGASISFPPEITKLGWSPNRIEYHCDQNFQRNNRECVQSWINAYDTNPGDATLAFLEGSHIYHGDFQKKYKIEDKSDWHKLTDDQIKFYLDRGCVEKKIMCPKGSLVMWESRTIHTGVRPMRVRKNINTRCVVYLCYMPKSLSTKANINKKLKAFDELRTTNHNPCKVKLFSKVPRSYGRLLPKVNELNKPILNDIGLSLAGFE